MPRSHVALRGGWLFLRGATSTRAVELNVGQELSLTGELHEQLWADPCRLHLLGGAFPALSAAAAAVIGEAQPANLGNVLKGTGWGLLFVELTGRCNERCVHCYASSSPEVDAELSKAQVLGIIADAARLGFRSIQFTGGDPLLSPHLPEAVAHARAEGFEQIEVYTNGLALREPLAQKLAEARVSMAFSVYSHDAAVHDGITRTPGSLERTLRAVRLASNTGISVRVGVVLRAENLHDAGPIRDLLTAQGVPADRIGIDRERPVGRGQWQADAPPPSEAWQGVHSGSRHELGAGKLAINYLGEVVPCIFDRTQVLGHIDEAGMGLRHVLSRPVHFDAPKGALLPVWGEPLACPDCRSRSRLIQEMSVERGRA